MIKTGIAVLSAATAGIKILNVFAAVTDVRACPAARLGDNQRFDASMVYGAPEYSAANRMRKVSRSTLSLDRFIYRFG